MTRPTPTIRATRGSAFFGGDVLKSGIQDPFKNGGFIPGGWPNGRRFGKEQVRRWVAITRFQPLADKSG